MDIILSEASLVYIPYGVELTQFSSYLIQQFLIFEYYYLIYLPILNILIGKGFWGFGIYHSEFNASQTEGLELFQIWVMPKLKNITPRYDQRTYNPADFKGQWKTVVSPLGTDIDSLQVNQDTYFNITEIAEGESLSYALHGAQQGAFVFVIEGGIEVAGENLGRRDAIGISQTEAIEVKASAAGTKVLLIEVPMVW